MHIKNKALKKILLIVLSWAMISQLLFYNAHFFLVGQIPEELFPTINYPSGFIQLSSLFMSMLGGAFFGYLMVMRKPRLSTFLSSIINISVIYLVISVLSVLVVVSTTTFIGAGLSGIGEIPGILLDVITDPPTLVSFFIWAFVLTGTQFMLKVNDMFGQGVLSRFISGKYFNPIEEERIFMFIDLKGSTSIAEKIGHRRFFELMRAVFYDITEPVTNYSGEIYQYVGDEVVISWSMAAGVRDASCIRCFQAIQDKLIQLESTYLDQYNVAPAFKAGVHHGKVMIGEIGVVKKDIVYSGDILNTTSRIQELCKNYRTDFIISGDTLGLMPENIFKEFQPLGEIELRGKKEGVNLYTFVAD